MKTVYVRNVDERTHAALRKEATRRGISLSELVRRILETHAAQAEVESLDQKYRAFVSDLTAMYQMDREEMQDLVEKTEKLYLLLIQKLERWDDEWEAPEL